jgi:hypothetical protein
MGPPWSCGLCFDHCTIAAAVNDGQCVCKAREERCLGQFVNVPKYFVKRSPYGE